MLAQLCQERREPDKRARHFPLIALQSAFSATALTWEGLADLVARAFVMFRSGRPRPVHIPVPLDVLEQPAEADRRSRGKRIRFHRWLGFLRPARPLDRAFAKPLGVGSRLACHERHWFLDIGGARAKIETWHKEVEPGTST